MLAAGLLKGAATGDTICGQSDDLLSLRSGTRSRGARGCCRSARARYPLIDQRVLRSIACRICCPIQFRWAPCAGASLLSRAVSRTAMPSDVARTGESRGRLLPVRSLESKCIMTGQPAKVANLPPAISIAADTTAWSICSRDHAKGTPRGRGRIATAPPNNIDLRINLPMPFDARRYLGAMASAVSVLLISRESRLQVTRCQRPGQRA
jgi:hypothetical protein